MTLVNDNSTLTVWHGLQNACSELLKEGTLHYAAILWTQAIAEEGFTIESVSIQPGWRMNVTKI